MKHITDEMVISKWKSLQANAKNRGLDFNLSLTSVKNLLRAEKCYYTGHKFVSNHPRDSRSVDRKDPKKGYVKGNVVACTIGFNSFKNTVEHLDKKGINAIIRPLQQIEKEL